MLDLLILLFLYSHLAVSQRQFVMTTGLTPVLWHILRLLALIRSSVKTLIRYLLLVRNRQCVQSLVCILDWNAWVGRSHDEVATHCLWSRSFSPTIDRGKVLLVLLLRLRRVDDALVSRLVLHGRVVIHRADFLVEVVSFNSQLAFNFLRFLDLIWKLGGNVSKLAVQVLDLPLFAFFD